MICPTDQTQMVQKDKLGGGCSDDNVYETWMILECPSCGRKVRECYSVRVLSDEQFKNIKYTSETAK